MKSGNLTVELFIPEEKRALEDFQEYKMVQGRLLPGMWYKIGSKKEDL